MAVGECVAALERAGHSTAETINKYRLMFARKLSDAHSEGITMACGLLGEESGVQKYMYETASH